jgi:flagellar FliL protein
VVHMLGMDKHEEHAAEAAKPVPPTYIDLPEMIANLNSGAHKPSYIKLTARIEVPKPDDAEKVKAALPRLQDMMQTYLREMRPEELRGSAGTYRLREELLVRANAAVAPAKVSDVLFTQMLVQ